MPRYREHFYDEHPEDEVNNSYEPTVSNNDEEEMNNNNENNNNNNGNNNNNNENNNKQNNNNNEAKKGAKKGANNENNNNNNKRNNNNENNNEAEDGEDGDGFTGEIEEFGNMNMSKFPIDLILKSIFFGAIFYLLSLPEVYKMTKKCCKKLDGVLLHSVVFAILYFILSQFIN